MKIENAVEFYHFKIELLQLQLAMCVDTSLSPKSSHYLIELAHKREACIVIKIAQLRGSLAALTIDVEF